MTSLITLVLEHTKIKTWFALNIGLHQTHVLLWIKTSMEPWFLLKQQWPGGFVKHQEARGIVQSNGKQSRCSMGPY